MKVKNVGGGIGLLEVLLKKYLEIGLKVIRNVSDRCIKQSIKAYI
jgi:hypothetical protein